MNYLSFMPEMAMAYARGAKRVTRRVIKHQPDVDGLSFDKVLGEWVDTGGRICRCPQGNPGDKIGLLTTWAVSSEHDDLKPTELPKDANIWHYFYGEKPFGFAPCSQKYRLGKSRPGRFLPLFLRDQMPVAILRGVGVEQVQDITEEDSILEGCAVVPPLLATQVFEALWNSINEKRGYGWEANPWVWVERVEPYNG